MNGRWGVEARPAAFLHLTVQLSEGVSATQTIHGGWFYLFLKDLYKTGPDGVFISIPQLQVDRSQFLPLQRNANLFSSGR